MPNLLTRVQKPVNGCWQRYISISSGGAKTRSAPVPHPCRGFQMWMRSKLGISSRQWTRIMHFMPFQFSSRKDEKASMSKAKMFHSCLVLELGIDCHKDVRDPKIPILSSITCWQESDDNLTDIQLLNAVFHGWIALSFREWKSIESGNVHSANAEASPPF